MLPKICSRLILGVSEAVVPPKYSKNGRTEFATASLGEKAEIGIGVVTLRR
jgi:hypothetical protein